MKETYRVLRATEANVRLVPGAPASSLAAAANAHQNTDLILIGPDVAETDLTGAWFFVPRMLNDTSAVLNECRMADGQSTFTSITRTQIAEWATRRRHATDERNTFAARILCQTRWNSQT